MPSTTRSQTGTTNTRAQPTRRRVPCPIPNCTTSFTRNTPYIIKNHLTNDHTATEIRCIPTEFYHKADVFKCPVCPTHKLGLFASNGTLLRHIQRTHKMSTRTETNTDLLLSTFKVDPAQAPTTRQNWERSLSYIHRHDITPFSFRKSIYSKLKFNERSLIQNLAYNLIELLIKAQEPHVDNNSPHSNAYQTSPSPIWKILLLFEGSLMAPATATDPKRNYQALIKRRVAQFLDGNFDVLYQNAMCHLSSPRTDTPTIDQRQSQILRAANNDDWKKASQLLQQPLPSVPFDDTYLPHIQALHPPPTPYLSEEPLPRPSHSLHQSIFSTADETLRSRLADPSLTINTLRRLKKDKSSGPYADSTDMLKDIFLVRSKHLNQKEERFPRIHVLCTLLSFLYKGTLPKDIRQYLNANESVAFHKDTQNLTSIRPIGIGTALRRIAAAHAMSVTKDVAAEYLSPHQFAVGMSSGIDVITHTIQSHTDTYIETPLSQNRAPTRAVLVLDLQNMFNSISMTKAREIVYTKFPHLLPLFDILYFDNTRCWYRRPDGSRHYITRREGSSQGCPFAAFLACLVLDSIVKKINQELVTRANARRHTHPDSPDDMAVTMCYIDDTTVSVHYDDLQFFLEKFAEIGTPLGCILKAQKCKILTSTTGSSPLTLLLPRHQQALLHCLDKYCGGQQSGEIVTGVRILGAPIGNKDFVSSYQTKKIQKLRKAIQSIALLVPDPHIAITLYKFSLQHYTTHLLFSDIIHHENQISTPKHYRTLFSSTINSITKSFLHKLILNPDQILQEQLPEYAWHIATTPTGLGGLGFLDTESRMHRTFSAPFANTIRSMEHGIVPNTVSKDPNLAYNILITLPRYFTAHFKNWKVNTSRIFQKYSLIANQYIENEKMPHNFQSRQEIPTPITLTSYTLSLPLNHTTKQIQKNINLHRHKTLWPTLPPDVKKHFPSLLSCLTSIPVGMSTRTDSSNHFSIDEFRIFLQRKLRMPLWPPPPKRCSCGKSIDKYGDHLFVCPQASKHELHNRMRDSVYMVCKHIFPLVSDTTRDDIHKELPHIFDKAPQLRPGDVVVKHPLNSKLEPHSTTLIDITIIPPYKPPNHIDTYAKISETMSTHHQQYEYKKLKLKDHAKSDSTANELTKELTLKQHRLLPFTIDHHGMMGPIATDLLIGHHNSTFDIAPNAYDKRSTSTETQDLIRLSMHKNRHRNILKKATNLWKQKFGSIWFTNTYHAQTPGQWAKQVLGNTFSIHSAKHILFALNKLNMKIDPKTPRSTKAKCSSMNLRTPTQYAVRTLRYSQNSQEL